MKVMNGLVMTLEEDKRFLCVAARGPNSCDMSTVVVNSGVNFFNIFHQISSSLRSKRLRGAK